MSTLVLEVQFNDVTDEQDIVFSTLAKVATYLNGQREDDYAWICLHDNDNDYVFEGWDDIHHYIRENTRPKLDVCGDACNCMKCNPSKSSCIALRASELSLPHVDVSGSELPRVERFSDLPDGTLFYLAQTYAYGGRQKYQKTLEDGGDHNAVWDNDPNTTARIRDNLLVIRVGDKA